MKIKSLSPIGSVLAGLLFAVPTTNAQVLFSFDSDNVNSGTNLSTVSFYGNGSFDGTSVDFTVFNDSSVASVIVGAYLLKPLGIEASTLDSPTSTDWTLTNTTNLPGGDPATILSSDISADPDEYFGAYVPTSSSEGITSQPTDSQAFSFTMAAALPGDTDPFWELIYAQPSSPHVLIRWRSVDGSNPNENGEDSAAGWAWFELESPSPPVPEPSEIGLLGLLGLGGMLFIRRRIKAKRKQD